MFEDLDTATAVKDKLRRYPEFPMRIQLLVAMNYKRLIYRLFSFVGFNSDLFFYNCFVELQ